MKNLEKDNKGFSLVELIVVVLIMAIIAVALAPQVINWVDNSRITADQNAAGNLKTATQVAIAELQAKGGTLVDCKYKIDTDGTSVVKQEASGDDPETTVGTATKLSDLIKANLGGEKYEVKYTGTDGAGSPFKIDITDGLVTVTGGGTAIDELK